MGLALILIAGSAPGSSRADGSGIPDLHVEGTVPGQGEFTSDAFSVESTAEAEKVARWFTGQVKAGHETHANVDVQFTVVRAAQDLRGSDPCAGSDADAQICRTVQEAVGVPAEKTERVSATDAEGNLKPSGMSQKRRWTLALVRGGLNAASITMSIIVAQSLQPVAITALVWKALASGLTYGVMSGGIVYFQEAYNRWVLKPGHLQNRFSSTIAKHEAEALGKWRKNLWKAMHELTVIGDQVIIKWGLMAEFPFTIAGAAMMMALGLRSYTDPLQALGEWAITATLAVAGQGFLDTVIMRYMKAKSILHPDRMKEIAWRGMVQSFVLSLMSTTFTSLDTFHVTEFPVAKVGFAVLSTAGILEMVRMSVMKYQRKPEVLPVEVEPSPPLTPAPAQAPASCSPLLDRARSFRINDWRLKLAE